MTEKHADSGMTAVRLLGIAGSLRPNSYTRRLVELALEGARQAGADVMLVDLATFTLPFCTGDSGWPQPYPDVERLRGLVRAADAVVWGTPQYHGSYSGLLKNALDLTDLDDWRGKSVALVGVAGGSEGPGVALDGLRSVGRGLRVWVLPDQVAVSSARHAFDENGGLKSEATRERTIKLGSDLVRFARLHSARL